jgi:hypothetical protein
MTSRAARTFLILTSIIALSASAARAQQITRIEQNDPSIVYSGTWWTNQSTSETNGQAALTNQPGCLATLTFTGTGITWIGEADGYSGLATVYLDGAMQVIDTYSGDPTRYQTPLFSAHGLAAGTHTLTIEVTHERDSHTQGSWVWIDAFDIENGAGVVGGVTASSGRIEENNPALQLFGRWYANTGNNHSGGSAILGMDAGSRITMTFNGTGVAWIGYRDQWSGLANVYIDGTLKTTIDTYLSPSQTQVPMYSIGQLPSGTHSITIEATGTRNQSSGGSWVWVDAFDVTQ